VTEPAREHDGDQPLRVSTLEFFFDLVFVFAITQLTGLLTEGTPVVGGVRVLLVFAALWWMYGGYVWLSNARTPERLLMLVGMAGFLIMGLSIPHAFGRDGVALGLGYLVVVLIHAGLYQRINSNIARVTPFNLAAALLVIGAGLVSGDGEEGAGPAVYALWAAAIAVQAFSPLSSGSAAGSRSSRRTSPNGTARWSSSCSVSRWWTSGSAPRGTR
jgi:low temperature requirement protein LtrA